jgi:hypothetical protein
LQGNNLIVAQLQGANLADARLQGANLNLAQLQGAELAGAQLQGANLESAELRGSHLLYAKLQGANLAYAQLQTADLGGAELQGADLENAQLQGADVRGAQLQGARLTGANLRGADFRDAQVQGADLSHADLVDSAFDGTWVFRTNIADANLVAAAVGPVYADQVTIDDNTRSIVPLTPPVLDSWVAAATQFAIAASKDDIAKRFDRLNSNFRDNPDEVKWSGMREASLALDPEGADHRRSLAKFLGDLACEPADAPYVARRFVPQGQGSGFRVGALGDQFIAFRTRLEDGRRAPEKCPGIVGFTEDDWDLLDAYKVETAPADH